MPSHAKRCAHRRIGLNDQASERRVVWSDGSPVDYVAWAPGEPNALDPLTNADRYNEDFVEMDFSTYLNQPR